MHRARRAAFDGPRRDRPKWAGLPSRHAAIADETEKAGFDALVTCDQNFVFQQNLVGRNIAVVVLSTNTWPLIRAQPQIVRRAVANATPGNFTVATFGRPRRYRPAPDLKC